MSQEIVQAHEPQAPMKPSELTKRIKTIDAVLRKVMIRDVHYGTIPGCGDKPALLKPGAEKIALCFRLAPEFNVTERLVADEHREYSVKCQLRAPDGTIAGEGIGVCSTMEAKYRYRWEAARPVPQAYWDARDERVLFDAVAWADPDVDVLKTAKRDGKWMILVRSEHDNPADYYNTVAKIAKKRAYVDAVLTTTGASDLFEQGEDEVPAREVEAAEDPTPKRDEPTKKTDDEPLVTAAQVSLIERQLGDKGVDRESFLRQFQIKELRELPFLRVNEALDWIKREGSR
jgi:hypothetical protein